MLSRGSQLNDTVRYMEGSICGNRLIFRINKHKSSASLVVHCIVPFLRALVESVHLPPTVRVSYRDDTSYTHTGAVGSEYSSDNYVFKRYKRGGTRGTKQRSVETRAMAIRHPKRSSTLRSGALYYDDLGNVNAKNSIVS